MRDTLGQEVIVIEYLINACECCISTKGSLFQVLCFQLTGEQCELTACEKVGEKCGERKLKKFLSLLSEHLEVAK